MRTLALVAALLLAGCVSFPVPPAPMGNMETGQLGRMRVQLTAKWEPNWQGVLKAALSRQLPEPKSLSK
ncbi:MAG: hypothetical protein FGM15_12740 [Chthoniobacterales bacterium]|nr:hypothetical protein [Chthoniobacterales bacterium]